MNLTLSLFQALLPFRRTAALDEKVVEEKRANLNAVLTTLEKAYLIEGHDYLGGADEHDEITIADIWGCTEIDQALSMGLVWGNIPG